MFLIKPPKYLINQIGKHTASVRSIVTVTASKTRHRTANIVRRRISVSRTLTIMAPTAAKHFDYIVIGGGSGGSGTARRAAGWYGANTLLIENGLSGGCCVNVG